MKLSRAEQETIITFNEADSTAEVFTYNGRMQRTLAKLATDRPAETTYIKTNPEGGTTYTIPNPDKPEPKILPLCARNRS